MALEEDEPFPPERTAGRPLRRRSRTLWRSADGGIGTGIPEVDAGRFRANFGANGELIRVITGEMHCSGDDGNDFSLRAVLDDDSARRTRGRMRVQGRRNLG